MPDEHRIEQPDCRADLAQRREQSEVYWVALPVLEKLSAQLASTESVLAFFDAPGCMLFLGGNAGVAERLAEGGFAPGTTWPRVHGGAEAGSAVSEGRQGDVLGPEQRSPAEQPCCRSQAPIVAAHSGELLGLVEITGHRSGSGLQEAIAARAIAHAVEERLRSVRLVLDQVVDYALHTAAGEELFAVDRGGQLLAMSEPARRRFSIVGQELPPAVRQALAAALRQSPGACGGALLVAWPGLMGKVALQTSPIWYERRAVGAVVRVADASPVRARSPAASARYDFAQILGDSEPIQRAVALARNASRNELPVVLLGESGVGKELFAQAIHSASPRADGPFIAVNCGCIPATLLESELFGYEAGTFTGGRREGKHGKFEEASGGTLFLDEVSELSHAAQTALLRVLQEREVVRLGGSSPRPVDVRVIAASNENLDDGMKAGRFRSDLFYRLHVLSIVVPPLRERRADVALLARAFLREAEHQIGCAPLSLSDRALRALQGYDWPGNVREMMNVILRAAATARGDVLETEDLPEEIGRNAPPAMGEAHEQARGEVMDREALLLALGASSWNVARTAQALHVSRMTLYRWLHRHGIERH